MKSKAKPQSKIPTTQKNTNQKKSQADALDGDTSLLKKNEFTLIIVGALVATVLVFFLFFRTSDNDSRKVVTPNAQNSKAVMDQGMETRVAELELALAKIASSPTAEDLAGEAGSGSPKGLAGLEQRVGRIETAMTLKLDSLIERIGRMERQLSDLRRKANTATAVKVAKTKAKPVQKPAVKKATVKKEPAKTAQKSSLFHTVKKGETLWSISQKYKTSVAAIRKLNNLTAKDKIYPGNNILVR